MLGPLSGLILFHHLLLVKLKTSERFLMHAQRFFVIHILSETDSLTAEVKPRRGSSE